MQIETTASGPRFAPVLRRRNDGNLWRHHLRRHAVVVPARPNWVRNGIAVRRPLS